MQKFPICAFVAVHTWTCFSAQARSPLPRPLSRAGPFPSPCNPWSLGSCCSPPQLRAAPPRLRFGDEELRHPELAQSRWRLRPKEELGHIPGHCPRPGPALGLLCSSSAAALLPCQCRDPEAAGDGRNRMRRQHLLLGSFTEPPQDQQRFADPHVLFVPLTMSPLSVPCTEISAPVLPKGLPETCTFSCWALWVPH